MEIIHKYEVGDQVMFKVSFKNPTCGLADKGGTVATIAGIAPSYDNKPHYYLEGEEAIYPESVFSGRYEAPAEPEEAKWYRISFSAKLDPDDLRAMKKCFFDAMNESMEIYDLEGLEITETGRD